MERTHAPNLPDLPDLPDLLEMRGITKSFPGVKALKGVDFAVRKGEVHALLGENGAGKSTLIKVLGGVYEADSGEIILNGRPVQPRGPQDAQRLGMSFIFQELDLVPQLSVADNVTLGRERARFGFVDRRSNERRAREGLSRLGVDIDPNVEVGRLSVAQQQMVAIAKALSVDASLIVMDEPSAPLTDHELQHLFRIIRTLKEEGVTFIYISHRLEEVFAICDRLTVFRDGEWIATKDVADTTRQELVRMMVGRNLDDTFPERRKSLGAEVLRLDGVSAGPLRDISLTLHAGEILGVAGLIGSGKDELASLLFGLLPVEAGRLWVDGKEVSTLHGPMDAIAHGLALVPSERRAEGLVGCLSVRDNISMAAPGRVSRLGFLLERADKRLAEDRMRDLRIKAPGPEARVSTLSGGNQQKVVLAKWLNAEPRILLLSEPTRGIDVGAKAEIFAIIERLTEQGLAVIMLSSEMEEVLGMCDTVVILHRGRVAGVMPRAEATREKALHYATGGTDDFYERSGGEGNG